MSSSLPGVHEIDQEWIDHECATATQSTLLANELTRAAQHMDTRTSPIYKIQCDDFLDLYNAIGVTLAASLLHASSAGDIVFVGG
jgi:hypothetical protein